MTTTIRLEPDAGGFADNKDEARRLRQEQILPALDQGEQVVLRHCSDDKMRSLVELVVEVDYSLGGFGELERLEPAGAVSRAARSVGGIRLRLPRRHRASR